MDILIHWIHSLDLSIYSFLNGFAGNWLFDRIADFEEGNKLFKGGLFLAMYAYVWFRVDPQQEQQRRRILAVFAGTLAALVVCRTIADFAPYRLRPMFELSLQHQAYSFPIAHNMENWSSFPSDTSAYFFALAFGLIRLLRRGSVLILLYTAGWICLPRMFLGEHYMSDIVVGAAIGIALTHVSMRSEWLRRYFASPVLRFMEAKPHVFYAAAFLILFEMAALFDDVRVAARGLFHVFRSGHAHELLPVALAGLGFLALVSIAAFLLRRPSATPKLADNLHGDLGIQLAALSKREELQNNQVLSPR